VHGFLDPNFLPGRPSGHGEVSRLEVQLGGQETPDGVSGQGGVSNLTHPKQVWPFLQDKLHVSSLIDTRGFLSTAGLCRLAMDSGPFLAASGSQQTSTGQRAAESPAIRAQLPGIGPIGVQREALS
jgi:hypothetical protein